ncbi:MAG TPA: ABC transporter permease [Gammaproteobacteria bacterium]|nr:ABC transporter permease [Gammaproteobacteria bacterium]
MSVYRIWTIMRLTFLEARRRRIVPAALACGGLFLLVYGTALYFIFANMNGGPGPVNVLQRQAQLEFLVLAGLYVVNFLAVAAAVLLPVDTLSGEIDSGVMQTLASKPIGRSDIVLGKWLTYLAMTAAYVVLMGGGIAVIAFAVTGFWQPHLERALPLMMLAAAVMLTVTTAGGVRLTTITNGIVAFGFYGLAFIGGWVEQIGTFTQNEAARYIGTAISLVNPSDALWRRAAHELLPPLLRNLPVTPFASASVPSTAMIVWAGVFVVLVLGLALRWFARRPL